MAMSAANQVRVSQAWLSLRHCFQLTTPEAWGGTVQLKQPANFSQGHTTRQARPAVVTPAFACALLGVRTRDQQDGQAGQGGGHSVHANRATEDPQAHGHSKGKGGQLLVGAHGAQLGQLLARLRGQRA